MTADGYRPGQSRSGGALSALMVSGTIVAGLALWSPHFSRRVTDPPIVIETLPLPADPTPPPPTQPHPRAARPETLIVSDPIPLRLPPTPPTSAQPFTPEPFPMGDPVDTGAGAGTGTIDPPPIAPPVFVDASIDGGSSLQPPYPPEEANAGREGTVTLRVHVGADGRVLAVEQVSATSPAFFRAAQRWAMGHWRFHPATRGGIPEDSWKVMRLRFELNE